MSVNRSYSDMMKVAVTDVTEDFLICCHTKCRLCAIKK